MYICTVSLSRCGHGPIVSTQCCNHKSTPQVTTPATNAEIPPVSAPLLTKVPSSCHPPMTHPLQLHLVHGNRNLLLGLLTRTMSPNRYLSNSVLLFSIIVKLCVTTTR